MTETTSNLLGALALTVTDRIEQAARDVLGRGGETPAALVVIGYGPGMTNDLLRRILGLSHSGAVRLVDRLVADGLVTRGAGRDRREIALRLTAEGEAARRRLMTSRLEAVSSVLDVLSGEEQAQLEALLRSVLGRQNTSPIDRYTICRLCDDGVCVQCPLPTVKATV